MTDMIDVDDKLIRILLNRPSGALSLTKTQLAYVAVRKAIVTHSLPAGIPLDEAMLLAEFPVGRTPLREALKRLTHERFLSWPPHQAPTVLDVGFHEMRYLYETRRLLEPTIARLAALRCDPADRLRLDTSRQSMVEASETGKIYDSVEHDFAIHSAIASASHNRFLAEASNYLNLQSLRLWYRAQERHGVANIHVMHTDLVQAISNGNPELAERLAFQHIESSLLRQQALLGDDLHTFSN